MVDGLARLKGPEVDSPDNRFGPDTEFLFQPTSHPRRIREHDEIRISYDRSLVANILQHAVEELVPGGGVSEILNHCGIIADRDIRIGGWQCGNRFYSALKRQPGGHLALRGVKSVGVAPANQLVANFQKAPNPSKDSNRG